MAWPDLLAAADRAALTHLGGAVRYLPTAGYPVDVRGIFDAAYVHASAGEAGVMTSGPAVFLRLKDLVSTDGVLLDPEEDEPRIFVEDVEYRVRESQRDGQGGVVLLLHRA